MSLVLDAGTGMLNRRAQKFGAPGEVYRCPAHSSGDCGMCGGTGFRNVCDSTHCHEYGCQGGCSRSREDFLIQQSRSKR